MEVPIFDPAVPKRPVDVRIDSDLAAQALKINISQELESHLADVVAKRRCRAWQEENQSAMDAYNRCIERDGLFSDGERLF
ncbi:MAG: type II toxin-antitoxin system CcdA family antitoxin [Nitrospirae bacterium]|nr:type II toxin-antitoxin system CcdA family antitoxin [Magnetococcales bacterium]